MRKRIFTICYIAAMVIVLYPFFANIWNSYIAYLRTVEYQENVADMENEEIEEEWAKAKAYNEALAGTSEDYSYYFGDMSLEEAYEECLNFSGGGVIGSIKIPKIDVYLPIYHGTDDEVLDQGIGHWESSSLPVGGEGTRAVLTGHRGLPGSKLFTYLDELEEGDIFYLYILDEVLAYEVCEIEIIYPSETENLVAEAGEDLCTLVTCTPYGINTHRLLVTGKRTEYTEGEEEETEASSIADWRDYLLIYAAIFETIVYLILRKRMKENEAN